MAKRPSGPPATSIPLELPSNEMIERLHRISKSHQDADVRLLAGIVARLSPAIEAIGQCLPVIAEGGFASMDPDVESESTERK